MTPHPIAIAALGSLAMLALAAKAGTSLDPALPAAANAYADQAAAVVYTPSIRQGSLLMLRGGVGDGWVTLRGATGWCAAMPLDFLFGDFDGSEIGIDATGPVTVLIMRPDLAQRLRDGQDLTSSGLQVRYGADLPSGTADVDAILIGQGLRDSGFVLDLDTSFLTELFGSPAAPTTCTYDTWRAALLADQK